MISSEGGSSGSSNVVAPCKVSYDPTTAKDMLLMAANPEEQQVWVGRLLKKIQKSGYKATSSLAASSGAGSLQALEGPVVRGSPKEQAAAAAAAAAGHLRSGSSFNKHHNSGGVADSNRLKSSTLPGSTNDHKK